MVAASATPTTAAVATTKFRSDGRAGSVLGSRGGLGAAAALALALVGCKARPASVSLRPEPPVPAVPADLGATLSVPSVAAFYGGMRALGGARASALPQSPELAFAAAAGLPVQAASALVLDQPAAGALLLAADGTPAVVFACRVRSGRELVLALSSGATPARHASIDSSGLTTLTANDGSAFGVVGDWLVLASTTDALGKAGSYVARVLATRTPAESSLRIDLAPAAFPRLAKLLGARWQAARTSLVALAVNARAEAGRPADFADPQAILGFADEAVRRLVARVDSSRAATLTLTLAPARAELALELEPVPGSVADAELKSSITGSLEPLLALPRESVLGVLSRGSSPAGGMPAKDDHSLAATLVLAGRGLGETTVLGLLPDESAVIESDLGDAALLEQSEKVLMAAVSTPELRAPLAPFFGKGSVRARTDRVPGFDAPVHHVVFPAARPGATPPELVWGVQAHEVLGAFGARAATSLPRLVNRERASSLAAEPELAAAAARRGAAAFAASVNLGGLAGAPAYVLLACGKRAAAARFELELNGAAAGFLARLLP